MFVYFIQVTKQNLNFINIYLFITSASGKMIS